MFKNIILFIILFISTISYGQPERITYFLDSIPLNSYENLSIYYDTIFKNQNEIPVLLQEEYLNKGIIAAQNILKQSRNYNLLIGFIIILLLGIGFLFWIIHQDKLRTELIKEDLENQKIIAGQVVRLKEIGRLKSNFFSNISHEFGTSLTLINKVSTKLAKKNMANPEAMSMIQIIKENILELIHLTDSILDLTKSEFKPLPVQIVQFQLSELIAYISNHFQPLANHKKIQYQPPIHVVNSLIISDAHKILIIIKNLLSNAFKYTAPHGKVTINMVDLGSDIQIIVQDNGRGISKNDLPYIFDRYFQTQNTNHHSEGGIGVGLALCKEYSSLLNGSISVDSVLGEGSTFVFTFPKKHPIIPDTFIKTHHFHVTPMQSEDLDTLPTENSYLGKLLIVEDNLYLCNYLKTVLQSTYELKFAVNGAEALELLLDYQPDLILTDLMMPVMSGMELLEKLKENEDYYDIPVLILTAKADLETRVKAFRIGVEDYLMKPSNDKILIAHIRNLLEFSEEKKKTLLEKSAVDKEEVISPSETAGVTIQKTPTNRLSKNNQEWLEKFDFLIRNSFSDYQLNLDRIAYEMSISVSQLNRKVKKVSGITPKRYVNELRLAKAKELLENEEHDSVKAVAFAVGFKSVKVFSKNFKARFGCYPSKYLY